MSWWVSLGCPHCGGTYRTEEPFTDGGTYPCGGTTECDVNITYNYSEHYYEHLNTEEGLRWIHGKTGEQCITALEHAVSMLGEERGSDYWEATKGNAGAALARLLDWARCHPDGVFHVD